MALAPRDWLVAIVLVMDARLGLGHNSINDSDKMSCISHWKYFKSENILPRKYIFCRLFGWC